MASDEATDAGTTDGAVTRVYRTVTPPYGGRPDAEMNTIGWLLFLGVLFLLFPLLPVILVGWLLSKVVEAVAGRSR